MLFLKLLLSIFLSSRMGKLYPRKSCGVNFITSQLFRTLWGLEFLSHKCVSVSILLFSFHFLTAWLVYLAARQTVPASSFSVQWKYYDFRLSLFLVPPVLIVVPEGWKSDLRLTATNSNRFWGIRMHTCTWWTQSPRSPMRAPWHAISVHNWCVLSQTLGEPWMYSSRSTGCPSACEMSTFGISNSMEKEIDCGIMFVNQGYRGIKSRQIGFVLCFNLLLCATAIKPCVPLLVRASWEWEFVALTSIVGKIPAQVYQR